MKLKFFAEVKRQVNRPSTTWEKSPWGVKSLVLSLVGSCSWSFWQSSSEDGMVTYKEKWYPSLSSGLYGSGEAPPSSPYTPPPRLLTTASQNPFKIMCVFFSHSPYFESCL